jgi:DNA-binding transcriptional MerR regulator
VRDIIESSSLGTVGARELRDRASEPVVEAILGRVEGIGRRDLVALPVIDPEPAGDEDNAVPESTAEGQQTMDIGLKVGDGEAAMGYRGPTACGAAGVTYRQLDYWARTGLVVPSVGSLGGAGTQRLYSFKDILVLKVIKRLLDSGVSLQGVRVAVECLRARGIEDLSNVTLLSDGKTVYECTSPVEVVDLLAGGQGVFGIAVGGALRELEGSLSQLPAERPDPDQGGELELATRRQRRRTSSSA